MKDKLKILNDYEKQISIFNKLTIEEAKDLYNKYLSTKDKNIKKELIEGTLYMVPIFIKSKGLLYLNSTSYSIEDIINNLNLILIDKIMNGDLLKVDSLYKLYDFDLINKLEEGLSINRIRLGDNYIVSVDTFIEKLFKYIKEIESKDKISLTEFKNIINRSSSRYYIGDLDNLKILFDSVIDSLNTDNITVSKTNLNILKYILISNGLEKQRDNIYKAETSDLEEFIDAESINELIKTMMNDETIDDRYKKVIDLRYGLSSGKSMTYKEVGELLGITRERVRQMEAKVIRKIRVRNYTREYIKENK